LANCELQVPKAHWAVLGKSCAGDNAPRELGRRILKALVRCAGKRLLELHFDAAPICNEHGLQFFELTKKPVSFIRIAALAAQFRYQLTPNVRLR
jgi:hypothetical protein